MNYEDEHIDKYGWKLNEIMNYISEHVVLAYYNDKSINKEFLKLIELKLKYKENINMLELLGMNKVPRTAYYDFKIKEIYNLI